MEVNFRHNGLTSAEIEALNLDHGRVCREYYELVGVYCRPVLEGTGSQVQISIMKVKEERYL